MTAAFAEPPETREITLPRAAGMVVLRPAPRREPPFDDELEPGARGAAPYDRPLPFERPRRHLTVQTPVRSTMPDPVPWARRLLLGVIESAGGHRPLHQLSTLLSPAVARGLREDFEVSAELGRPHWIRTATIRSLRSSEPVENVAELSATVRAGSRVRAVALRLEVRHGRWCCTRLMLG